MSLKQIDYSMTTGEPLAKLRTDLAVSEQTSDGQTYYVLNDPITHRYFRLRAPEYFLIQQFDGHTDINQIAARVKDKFGIDITPDAIEKFMARVDELYFFEGTRSEYEISSGRYLGSGKRSLLSRLLFIKLKAFDPQRLLNILMPPFRPLFHPLALLVMMIFTIAGFFTYSANFEFFRFASGKLFSVASIITIFISLALIIFVHEFAHALTCRYFGGKVREMGFLLLYFQLCFYSNLSDSWMFKRKSDRLAVIWSGLFFQMVIFAAAVFGWRLTVIESGVNQFFWLTANVCFVTLLFNLNPLIKLDGYYLLSEIVNIPNLRDRSFGYLKARLRQSLGIAAIDSLPTGRERRIYLTYTILAGLYSAALIIYILIITFRFLVDNLQGAGFALFLVLAIAIFGQRLVRTARYFSRREVMTAIVSKRRNLIVGGIVLVVAIIVLFIIPFNRQVGSEVTINPLAEYAITLPEGQGRLELNLRQGGSDRKYSTQQIQLSTTEYSVLNLTPLVKEGDQIKKGDTLAAVISNQVSSGLKEARAQLEQMQGELALAQAPPKPEEVATAEATVNANKAALDRMTREIERDKTLIAKNLISRQEFENAQAQLDITKSNLQEAEARLRLVKSPPKPEQVSVLRSKIAAQEANINYITTQEAAQVVTSPIAGVVTALYRNSLLFKISDLSHIEVSIAVPDAYLEFVKPGAAIKLKVRTFPGDLFAGTVAHIASSANGASSDLAQAKFIVHAVVDNAGGQLKDGMSGYAKIDCGKASLWTILSERVKSFIRVEFWSWW
jgi:putative peptide zinc metalloprotease protein